MSQTREDYLRHCVGWLHAQTNPRDNAQRAKAYHRALEDIAIILRRQLNNTAISRNDLQTNHGSRKIAI